MKPPQVTAPFTPATLGLGGADEQRVIWISPEIATYFRTSPGENPDETIYERAYFPADHRPDLEAE